ncbi:hypothetical protein RKE38_06395 [Phycicoccus sp. M110.8]|uniref:hypothetical protein n=1 Tax=Phycicoccus sp. M110.8 TaxID=3075433 RepID=UPI0028FD57D2|nr:hypothetical protein [Phycicoccus sp. M110.8]MDU0313312.1 hypothetical protein [Phycicoccus sp. M110.8]
MRTRTTELRGAGVNPFDVRSVNILDVATMAAMAVAAAVVLARGRGAPWSVLGGTGFALLALTRLANLLVLQWLVRSDATPIYERVRTLQLLNGAVSLIGTIGLALLLAAVLAGRSRAAAGPTTTGATAPAGSSPPA